MNYNLLFIWGIACASIMSFSTFTYFQQKKWKWPVLLFSLLFELAFCFAIGLGFGLFRGINPIYGFIVAVALFGSLLVGYAIYYVINLKLLHNGTMVSGVRIVGVAHKSTTEVNDELAKVKYTITFQDSMGNLYNTLKSYEPIDIVRLNKMGGIVTLRVRKNMCIVISEIPQDMEVTEDDFKSIEGWDMLF